MVLDFSLLKKTLTLAEFHWFQHCASITLMYCDLKLRQTKKAANNLWHLWHKISFLSFKDYF